MATRVAAAVPALPLAFLLTFSAVTVVRLLLAVTDWMSESTFGGNADDTAAALVHVRNAFVATVPIDVSFVPFLMSVMTAVLALVVWVELSLREAAIYVAVDFLPLTFVAMVWQPTAIWCQRLAEGLLSVILSKFVLAASFALAVEALGQADSGQGDGGGFTTMIAGGAAFLMAALTPWVLFRLIPMTHTASSQSVNRQQVSGAISSMPGATMAKMTTQTLIYGRFGRSGGGSAQAATAQPRASAARRTDAGADAPVAVIPDPKPQPRSRPGAR